MVSKARPLVVNEQISVKDLGTYVQVYQREGESVQFDLNFFEGVKTLDQVETLRSLLDRAINIAKQKEKR